MVRLGSEGLAALSPTEAVDLLERAAAWGRAEVVDALYDALGSCYPGGHPFFYESYALALALRYAHEDVARNLLDRGVDLLAKPHRPQGLRAMVPPDDTFTRFGLTRASQTLFLNPMDPTVSTEAFRDPHANEQLAGEPYAPTRDLAATCGLISRLAAEGLFEATVYDDLFRASLTAAWHALRHADKDEQGAQTCLALCHELLVLHRADGSGRHGDGRLFDLMEKMIVPRGDRKIALWICDERPTVFLHALTRLDWLRDETGLVTEAARHLLWQDLSDAPSEDLATLLAVLAGIGEMSLVEKAAALPQVGAPALGAALEAASSAGHPDMAGWLIGRIGSLRPAGSGLDDLLL